MSFLLEGFQLVVNKWANQLRAYGTTGQVRVTKFRVRKPDVRHPEVQIFVLLARNHLDAA